MSCVVDLMTSPPRSELSCSPASVFCDGAVCRVTVDIHIASELYSEYRQTLSVQLPASATGQGQFLDGFADGLGFLPVIVMVFVIVAIKKAIGW